MAWSRRRRWTDDQLRIAIASSSSFRGAAEKLGSRESRRGVKRRARELGIDVSHFAGSDQRTQWTDAQLANAVRASRSIAGVLRALGLRAAGGNYASITRHIALAQLDTAHFTGQGWNVDGAFRPRMSASLDELLVRGRPTSSHRLKQRLIAEGYKPAHCERCGWAEHSADGRLPLELDHINGDHDDNRLENLRVLCPNCHSLQPTHRARKRRIRS